MDWWVWALIGAASVMLVVNFFIIGGMDPRKWKGGDHKK